MEIASNDEGPYELKENNGKARALPHVRRHGREGFEVE